MISIAEKTALVEASDLLTAVVALVIGTHDEELSRQVVPELDRVRSILTHHPKEPRRRDRPIGLPNL
jgi:hypothetical protein